jgi:hypothetical protein
MHPSPRRLAPASPPVLQAKVSHAHRFIRTLDALHAAASVDDAPFLWLEGRAEEVRVFTDDVVRAWASGDLDVLTAARVIDDYLGALHASLETWYGRWYAPSCCGPLSQTPASGVRSRSGARSPRLAPRDPLADTFDEAPTVDLGAHRPLRIGGIALLVPHS